MRDTMPIYEYQCDECGLRAEKLWKRLSTAKATIECASCGEDMRKLVSATNFAFKHGASQTRGMARPSTGTSDDWNFDKAVGRDAEAKWKIIDERRSAKDKHIREERASGRGVNTEHLVRTPDGDYRTIQEPERKAVNSARSFHHEVTKQMPKAPGKGPPKDS
jgi:putative FmdB family regulatory protein